MLGKGLNRVVQNIMYTDRGRFILSIILGLGLATIFRNYCKGKNCYDFIGPKQKEIKDQVFSFDSNNSQCYVMREKTVSCNNNKKIVNFS